MTSLAKYVTTESPVDALVPKDILPQVQAIATIANEAINQMPTFNVPGRTQGPGLSVRHVGALYAWLYWLFLPDDKITGPWKQLQASLPENLQHRHLKDEHFQNPLDDRQAVANGTNDWDLAGADPSQIIIETITNRKDALQTLFEISAQGEGTEATAHSHFERFFALYNTVVDRKAKGLPVSLNVPFSPTVFSTRPLRTITNPISLVWAQLFNVRYQILVLKLWYSMLLPRVAPGVPPTTASRPNIIQGAIMEMTSILRVDFALRLVQLPLKPRPPVPVGPPPVPTVLEIAGAPFEFPDAALPTEIDVQKKMIQSLSADARTLTDLFASLPTKYPADPDKPTEIEVSQCQGWQTDLETFVAAAVTKCFYA